MKYLNIFIVLFLVACSETVEQTPEQKAEKTDTLAQVLEEVPVDIEVPEGWIQIDMNAISFWVENMDMNWDQANGDGENKCHFKDTAFFELWPGDWMENKQIKVLGNNFEITELWVQEISVIGVDSKRTIEVPFCRLSDWKKSASNWVKIEPQNNAFKFKTDYAFESEPIAVELNELQTAIQNSCGEEWYKEFEKADSLNAIPFSETVLQYQYKIVTLNTTSGQTFEHFMVFETPSSC
ncbi:MAG: hypothetical protein ACWA41_06235 [Putridiphycobacter sp.]